MKTRAPRKLRKLHLPNLEALRSKMSAACAKENHRVCHSYYCACTCHEMTEQEKALEEAIHKLAGKLNPYPPPGQTVLEGRWRKNRKAAKEAKQFGRDGGMKTQAQIEERIHELRELRRKVMLEHQPSQPHDVRTEAPKKLLRIEGNIGALEWVLREIE
jgi:hypothetical protein